MIGAGRPLRFLLLVIGGWTGLRLWCCWPVVATMPALIQAAASVVRSAGLPPTSPGPNPVRATTAPRLAARPAKDRVAFPVAGTAMKQADPLPIGVRSITLAEASDLRFADPVPTRLPAVTDPARARGGSRLSGSAWLLVRDGPALASGLAGGQLGGSQAGVRLAFAVDPARRLALVGRLSTAIGASDASRFLSDREGAIGVSWRPTWLPVTLIAEQRFVFEHDGHGGPMLGVIAGLPPTPIAAGFRLEAYGQAGAIARAGTGGTIEGFGDGAARLTRPLVLAGVHLDVGGGTWGGAQRGAARLDIGPTLGAAVPVAGRSLRLAVDWRQRIAGDARPGSGPALSLGTDF